MLCLSGFELYSRWVPLNILQIADVALRVVFLLFLLCFLLLLRLVPAVVFTLETSEVFRHFYFHNQNNSASFPRCLNL